VPDNSKTTDVSRTTDPPAPAGKASGGRSRGQLYDQGYYHGANSGYPAEGYRDNHPDWEAWLSLISAIIPPPASLFDIGTAFGYLPEKANNLGYQSAGCDISSYALRQEPSIRDRLLRADSEMLPVQSDSADIVCLFDILEHLDDPVRAMEEAARILRPDGLLIGATPDPLFFCQEEETHCFERCPSFWIHHLERLGLDTVFRFSNIPENFQFLAASRNSELVRKLEMFQHDYLTFDRDILLLEGSEKNKVVFVLRQGWEPFGTNGRGISGESASAYLLNKSESPLECRATIELHCPSSPPRFRLRLDSLVIDSFSVQPEESTASIISDPFPLPPGGHHINIDLFPSQQENLRIKSLKIETIRIIPPEEHILNLPFDLHQRYRFAGEIAAALRPDSILDAGGNLGDAGGHLAVSREFFTSQSWKPTKIVSTDLRHCDHPGHVPGDGLQLPFPDDSFDMTVSLDVLEHIQPGARSGFLAELDRVTSRWLLIGAPFSSSAVKEAEDALVSELGLHFLEEHSELGLPEEELITGFFREDKGRQVLSFENGHLERWFQMLPLTQMAFSLHNYRLYSLFNRHYNEKYYRKDCSSPGYRKFFLVAMNPLADDLDNALCSLPGYTREKEDSSIPARDLTPFPFYGDFMKLAESRSREAADLSFLLTAREKHIDELRQRLEEYEESRLTRIIRKINRLLKRDGGNQAGIS
jgi:SAM-dependent methyltransferase